MEIMKIMEKYDCFPVLEKSWNSKKILKVMEMSWNLVFKKNLCSLQLQLNFKKNCLIALKYIYFKTQTQKISLTPYFMPLSCKIPRSTTS